MGFRDLVRRYQSFDPATGRFDCDRNADQYATLLGVHPSQLSRFYSGKTRGSRVILTAFLRTFPGAAHEVGDALLVQVEQQEVASVAD